ncbi:hypothetical protein AB0J94_26675 [Micromonospora noduli]|uniref:hypothetical protein n=1 Tax=Micromonospora noduli TaxID=709876 RepID=UPI0034252158
MTDNLGPMRQAMSDLAEHGGSTDMYERALRKSRQSQRRTAFTTGAAAVVLAIGAPVTFATVNRPGPSTPVATQPPAPSVAPTSAIPSTTPSSTPSTTPPSSSTPSSTRTSNRPQYPDCPSAKTLEKLVKLPKDWYFVPSSVSCWRAWATAEPDGPITGDGVYLFHYRAGGGWRYHSQGSAFHCEDLGITSGNPPFCEMD